MSDKPERDWVPVKLKKRTWAALKVVEGLAPERLAASVATHGKLLEAIGDGDDELLMMWRKYQKAGRKR